MQTVGAVQSPVSAESGVQFRPGRPRRRLVLISAVLVAALLLVIVALAEIPVSQSFSMNLNPAQGLNPPQGAQARSWPVGTAVHFSWRSLSGGPVNFSLRDLSTQPIYQQYAANGSFAFTSNGGPYSFGFLSPVRYLSSNAVEISGAGSHPLF
jgi:hypothetical protein